MKIKTDDFLQTLLTAPEKHKAKALKVLRGEISESSDQNAAKQAPGSLVMGMSAAAKHLGVSRPTLWRMIRAGRLQKVEIYPGAFRVNRSDLEAIAKTYERRTRKHV